MLGLVQVRNSKRQLAMLERRQAQLEAERAGLTQPSHPDDAEGDALDGLPHPPADCLVRGELNFLEFFKCHVQNGAFIDGSRILWRYP